MPSVSKFPPLLPLVTKAHAVQPMRPVPKAAFMFKQRCDFLNYLLVLLGRLWAHELIARAVYIQQLAILDGDAEDEHDDEDDDRSWWHLLDDDDDVDDDRRLELLSAVYDN